MPDRVHLTGEAVPAGAIPAVDRDAWLAAAGDMSRLTTRTYDGITIQPLYDAADAVAPEQVGTPGAPPFVRGRTAVAERGESWDVRQRVTPTAGAAVAELERGATSLLVDLRTAPAIDARLLDRLLDGVQLAAAPIVLDAGARWQRAGEALLALWEERGVAPADRVGSLGADPLGEWASDRAGHDPGGELAALARVAQQWAHEAPAAGIAIIDGTRFHDAGGSDAQELGYALAVLVGTLRALVDGGDAAVEDALARFEVRLAATVDQFATIAKFRAARRVIARVAELAGAPAAAGGVALHAVTSRAMSARYDPAVNVLRATVACFAARVAGADAVTVVPYDELVRAEASELGRRVARNTPSVLTMESHLAHVVDPAGGSWYVERRTAELAAAAWVCFQEIEAAGGFHAAVEADLLDTRIAATRAARDSDVDRRRLPLTGVSEFPDLTEPPLPPAAVVSSPGDGSLARHRWSERFEELRGRVDAMTATTGRRPCVFLVTLGPLAEHTARATFARNLFAVAGIDALAGAPAEFAGAGTTVACLCGTDFAYRDSAIDSIALLAAAGVTRIYVAGRPDGALDGVVAIHAGCDAYAVLADLLAHMGIP